MNRLFVPIIVSVLTCIALLAAENLGHASRPVERVLKGCVLGGQFYNIYINESTGKPSQAYPIHFRGKPDLTPYEGKTITVEGWLSPGDSFSLKEGTKPSVTNPVCTSDNRRIIERRFVIDYVVAAHKAAKNNDFNGAFKNIKRALEIDPTDCQTYIDRAYVYYLYGDSNGGDRDVRFVTTRRCADPYRLNFLTMDDVAQTLLRHGRRVEAVQLYRFALETCTSDICREKVEKEIKKLNRPNR